MADNSRLTNIDALRGIASLSVCWFHMTNGYSAESAVRASGHFGWLGVEVFFVISGFIIPHALFMGRYQIRDHWKTFMWKRVLRIEPPYLLAMLLALSLWYLSSVTPGFRGPVPDPSFMQVSLHLGYLNGIFGYPWLNPVFWTLAIEFQFYLLVSVAFGLISSRNTALLASGNFACLVLPFFMPSNVWVFHYLGLFLFGIAAYQFRAGLIGVATLMLYILAAALSVWLTHSPAAALVGVITCALMLGKVNWGMQPLLTLGALSYSLYLVHVPVGGRIVNLGKRYVEGAGGEAVLSIAGILASLAFAYAFYRLVEMPAQKLASRFRYSN